MLLQSETPSGENVNYRLSALVQCVGDTVQCTYNTMWKCMQDFFQRGIKVFYHITNNFTFGKVINYYKYYKSNENYVYIQP